MGLTNWWLARSEDAATSDSQAKAKAETKAETKSKAKSKRLQWSLLFGLRRGDRAARKSVAKAHAVSQCISSSVHQAKDFLQQQYAAVSLCPTFVQLDVPCTPCAATTPAAPAKTESTAAQALVQVVVPVPTIAVAFDVASEAVLALETRVETLHRDHALCLDMTSEGCGGAYFLRDVADAADAQPICIFKPRNEEYMAPKNPRGYVKEGAVVGVTEHPTNKGFLVGNGALRERAAYLLDEAYGHFSGVPVTSLVSLPVQGEIKEGSIQAFVPSECSAEDMGSLKFSVPEVHKIGILDVRLFNTDRHAGNILLHSRGPHVETFAMTPIDHGFCLPSYKHLDGAFMDWLQWPQSEYPFTSEELEHISSLDATHDAAILRSVGIEEECITTMRICTALLQHGAEAGFSLHEIGAFLQREGDFSQPSTLETMVAQAALVVSRDLQEAEDAVAFMDAVVAQVGRAIQRTLQDQPKKKVRSISCFS